MQITLQFGECVEIKSAVSVSFSRRRPVRKSNVAPARANCSAVARPIPDPAPVIKADLFGKVNIKVTTL
jgi:hypothetical protein